MGERPLVVDSIGERHVTDRQRLAAAGPVQADSVNERPPVDALTAQPRLALDFLLPNLVPR